MPIDAILIFLILISFVAWFYFRSKYGENRYTLAFYVIGLVFAILFRPVIFGPLLIGTHVGIVAGLFAHEIAHYSIARLFLPASDLSINFRGMYVRFESCASVPDWGIRAFSVAPYGLGSALVVAYILIFGVEFSFIARSVEHLFQYLLVGLVLGTAFGVSPSDCLGILYPDSFRELVDVESEQNVARSWEMLKENLKT